MSYQEPENSSDYENIFWEPAGSNLLFFTQCGKVDYEDTSSILSCHTPICQRQQYMGYCDDKVIDKVMMKFIDKLSLFVKS